MLQGASTREKYEQYWEFKASNDLLQVCLTYANNYNDAMLDKIEEEQPDFFSANNILREQLQ